MRHWSLSACSNILRERLLTSYENSVLASLHRHHRVFIKMWAFWAYQLVGEQIVFWKWRRVVGAGMAAATFSRLSGQPQTMWEDNNMSGKCIDNYDARALSIMSKLYLYRITFIFELRRLLQALSMWLHFPFQVQLLWVTSGPESQQRWLMRLCTVSNQWTTLNSRFVRHICRHWHLCVKTYPGHEQQKLCDKDDQSCDPDNMLTFDSL